MNKKISVGAAIALIIVFMALTVSVTMVVAMRQFNTKLVNVDQRQKMYEYITEVDKVIRQHYVGKISEEELRTSLAKGYLSGIGDPYAEYLTADEYAVEKDRLAGSLNGLGLEVAEQDDGSVVISAVHPESSADKAGVQKGDVITALDGAAATYAQVSGRLASGEKLLISVQRGEESMAFELSPSPYTATTVESWMVGTTGYVRIRAFYSNTPDQFSEALSTLADEGAQSYVFDLRYNEGGVLEAAEKMIAMLLPRGTYARRIESDGTKTGLESSGTHDLTKPTVTLVNAQTAGEAELFAGVLQEFQKTSVVGTATKGRGKIQEFFSVASDGSAIKLSVASLALLEGGEIEGKGIRPDQTVTLTAEEESRFAFLTDQDDPQLKAALTILQSGTVTAPETTTTAGTTASTAADTSGTTAAE
ncbi:MAG TPA: PDZ domain-containing protein [Firmicutes bacterium]|nr:PDZ domain-containing protein [Bacillota bacterium]